MTTALSSATGKRKSAIARVWLSPGTGRVTVRISKNHSVDADAYFCRDTLRSAYRKPFVVTETDGKYDILCRLDGGGHSGQADALSYGISKALQIVDPVLRAALKDAMLLRRDPRCKERSKVGFHGARRGTQWNRR